MLHQRRDCASPVDFEVFEVMAPKVASGGWFVRHEPASYPNGPKPMTKCEGEKSKRRDVPGRVDRWIKTHMSHVNKMLLRTSLVDGLRVEQQLHNDILSLADNGRLSCRYRDALLTKYAFEMKSSKHGSFKVKDHKMAVNTELKDSGTGMPQRQQDQRQFRVGSLLEASHISQPAGLLFNIVLNILVCGGVMGCCMWCREGKSTSLGY